MTRAALVCALLVAAGTAPLVEATSKVPGLLLDLRYATTNNFLQHKVYPDGARCLLLPQTADALARASKTLAGKGYRLRAYDCFRPRSVQYEMWKIFPKPGYVANPDKGSNHNRGAAVDITLAELDGGWVEMPTEFDSFTPAAHQGYEGGTVVSRVHRVLLREA
jgi:D-alanyl-D-alanine dipeptidase